MSKSQSTFSAGNAGASTFINLNGNLGGGNKKTRSSSVDRSHI